MKFICVCSGISSPTSAWSALGWKALAYAEIDPFASAILSHRYGAGRPRFMPDPDEPGLDLKEARSRANAIKALARVEWGTKTPNFGDFTRLRDESFIVDADVLIGGTPCQDFSLAGLRASLGGARGNLTLEFIRLANAVDDLRRDAGKPPRLHHLGKRPRGLQHQGQRLRHLLGRVGRKRTAHPTAKRARLD